MGKVKVKKIVECVANQPIIVRFEHADLKLNESSGECIDLSPGTAASVFKPAQKTGLKSGNSLKKLLAIQHDRITYIGSNDSQFSSMSGYQYEIPCRNPSELRTFIGIRRKNKMSLYEALPITVAPYRDGHSHVKDKERDTAVQRTVDERKAASDGLVKAFGSKKKVLTQERREKAATDAAEMEESLQTAAEAAMNAVGGELPPEYKDDSIKEFIPPCNRETNNVLEVYNLEDIITSLELEELDATAEDFLNLSSEQITTWREAKKFSDYFFIMWHRLSSRKTDIRAKKTAKLVLYTEVLICLLKLRHEDFRKKGLPSLPSEFPLWLVEKAVNCFTTVNAKGVRHRPDTYRDKTCCYIFVLILLANDFNFDVQMVTLCLQLHIKKLLTLAKAVGITVKYNAFQKIYQGHLKLPLPKPIERRGRARKMR